VFFLSSSSHVAGYYLYISHNRILSDSYLTVIVIPHCHRHTTSMLLPESLNEPYTNGNVGNIHGNMTGVNPGNDETGKPRGRTTRVEEDKEIASERRRSDAPCDWPTPTLRLSDNSATSHVTSSVTRTSRISPAIDL
jgi:hypothetical protein